ncbi:hypothetical protein HELRODRAFT_160536 [Helobdella robusta]|uniref:Uncharacterized protein n=1 Tax=Helobdella robusta TaxID=6412 RepID=T1EQD7_HELRO|nr:hypothetical protein HELRODRAFT_160536 [Helobdella robusta]ESO06369.1 hypothetical protein HELRODRAFT_160536 [Helobdella robusta]
MEEFDLSFSDTEMEEPVKPHPSYPVQHIQKPTPRPDFLYPQQYNQHDKTNQVFMEFPSKSFMKNEIKKQFSPTKSSTKPNLPSGLGSFSNYYQFMSETIDEQGPYRMMVFNDFMTANLNTTAHGIPNYARANGIYHFVLK